MTFIGDRRSSFRVLTSLLATLALTLAATVTLLSIAQRPAHAAPPFDYAFLTGQGPGDVSRVKAYDRDAIATDPNMTPYSGFTGGVFVASGDVNGDFVPDVVTAPAAGGGPHVKVFSGSDGGLLRSFFAYNPAFRGGVSVATGDVNGDGFADVITGAGPGGGPHVKVWDGESGVPIRGFFPYDTSYRGGVFVAAGDLDGDGVAEVITGPGANSFPQVNIHDGETGEFLDFFYAYNTGFRGGVRVASGDVNGDGIADVVTGAGAGGGPHVKSFDLSTGVPSTIRSFLAYSSTFRGGVFVAAADVLLDASADIITGAGAGGGPHVKVFDGATNGTAIRSFFPFPTSFRGGVRVGGNLGVVPPTLTITDGPEDESTTADATPTYEGTATDDDGIVTAVFVSVDLGEFSDEDVECTGCGTDAASWSYTPSSPLADGDHLFIFVAVDNSTLFDFDIRALTIDAVPGAPSVTVEQAAGQPDPDNTSPINFTATFSEEVVGFTASDVTIGGTAGGTKTAVITGDGPVYNIAISGMTTAGTVTASIAAGTVTDGAGNPNTASTSTDNTVTWDATAPTFDAIAAGTGTTVVHAFFSEPLLCSTVAVSDFTAAVAGVPRTINSVTCTSTSDSTIDLTLAGPDLTAGQSVEIVLEGTVTDPAGNPAPAPTSRTTTADATAPTVTINQAAGQSDPTNDSAIDFTATFSEPVTGFTGSDVTITGSAGGTKTAIVTGGPTVYNVAVSGMTSDGTVTASIPAAAATDLADNPSAASTSTDDTVTWDATAPSVTVNQAAGQADPTNTSPINFTVVFSESVTGFTAEDVTVAGTAGGTLTPAVTGSGTTYNVAVSGMTTAGTVIVTVPAGGAADAAGNTNATSTSTDNTVTWDPPPTVTVNQAAGQADPTNDEPINFTAVFSEPVTGFAADDVTIGGTAGGDKTAVITGGPSTYNIAVSGMTSGGTVTVSIAAGRVVDTGGFGNTASTSTDNTVTWDPVAPAFAWIVSTTGSSVVTAVFTSVDDGLLCSTVAASDFTATVDGTLRGVTGLTCSGATDATINLNLATPVLTQGQTVIVSLTGSVTDAVGNAVTNGVSQSSVASSPTISVTTGPADGSSTADTTPTFGGTATDDSGIDAIEVSTDGGLTFSAVGVTCTGGLLGLPLPCSASNPPPWSYTPATPLAPGTYTFVFRTVDDVGGFSQPAVRRVTITA